MTTPTRMVSRRSTPLDQRTPSHRRCTRTTTVAAGWTTVRPSLRALRRAGLLPGLTPRGATTRLSRLRAETAAATTTTTVRSASPRPACHTAPSAGTSLRLRPAAVSPRAHPLFILRGNSGEIDSRSSLLAIDVDLSGDHLSTICYNLIGFHYGNINNSAT